LAARVAEYTQKTQTKVEEFKYASGNKVVEDFVATDWKFHNTIGCLTTLHNLDGLVETQKPENYIQNTEEQKEWSKNHFRRQ
jgi:hypothetical protein